jgi:hypothetical protein
LINASIFEAFCIDFQHIAGCSRDPVAEFNIREAFDIAFKPLVFRVFHRCFNDAGNGKPDLFLIDVQRVFFDDAERFEPPDPFGHRRWRQLIFLPSSRIDKRLSFFNSAMILKSRSSIFICNFIPSILFHYFNIFTKILSFEIHISLLLIYDYEEVIII